MRKLRVGVLMGGKSIEKEVSFNSGRTVCDHLDTARYEVIPIFQTEEGHLFILPWHFLHRGKINDFKHRLQTEAEQIVWDDLKKRIDFVYIATHGQYAEDGTLQGMLEVLGIPYLGSDIFASALCMDKIIQKTFLRQHSIDVPKDISLTPNQVQQFDQIFDDVIAQLEAQDIQPPYVVKPFKEGSSLGVRVVHDPKDLKLAVQTASTIHPEKPQAVLIEEKITGMEFSCITLTDYKTGNLLPLPPTEIVPEPGSNDIFDYDQKYMPGRATKFTPPRCSEKIIKNIQQTCMQVMHALGIKNISRIDGFVTKNKRMVIIDPNTLSGMAPSSFLFREAAEINMSHTQLINHLIETDLHTYGMLDEIIKQEQEKAQTMKTKKVRVAVLIGGRSHEKEISLESGRNITYKLSPHKYEAIPVFVSSKMELYQVDQSLLVRNSTKEIESMLDQATKIAWNDLPTIVDFVFIGLHGGEGENGAVQGTLEMLGLPYNGSSVLTSALCMDKFKTAAFLKQNGFDVPNSILVDQVTWCEKKDQLIENAHLTFPLIVKPHDDGCSVMVEKIKTKKELEQSINTLFAQGKNYALIEEYVTGMELTVGVIGNENPQALPPSQTIATQGILSIEEKFLPGAGENQTPAPLPSDALALVQKTMEQAYKKLQCKGYARIDCFYQSPDQSKIGKERIIILEVNTLPGMTPATCIFHQAAEIGMKPMDFIDTIIQYGFEEHCKKQSLVTTKEQKVAL